MIHQGKHYTKSHKSQFKKRLGKLQNEDSSCTWCIATKSETKNAITGRYWEVGSLCLYLVSQLVIHIGNDVKKSGELIKIRHPRKFINPHLSQNRLNGTRVETANEVENFIIEIAAGGSMQRWFGTHNLRHAHHAWRQHCSDWSWTEHRKRRHLTTHLLASASARCVWTGNSV